MFRFLASGITSNSIVLAGVVAGGLTATTAAMAGPVATSITIESATSVSGLTSGGSFGPPAPATLPDGPFTVASGTSVALTGGPGSPAGTKKHPIAVDSVLLVLSGDAAALGSKTISLTFGTLGTIELGASDFFSTSSGGFPTSIGGIAEGAVNGIKFPDSEHAAADILFSSGIAKGDVLGDLTIVSPIDLRVDVFGDADGKIIGNAANSGAEGVLACTNHCGGTDAPEPASLALLASGIIGLVSMRRRGAR